MIKVVGRIVAMLKNTKIQAITSITMGYLTAPYLFGTNFIFRADTNVRLE